MSPPPSLVKRFIAIAVGAGLATFGLWFTATDSCLDLGGRVEGLSCEFLRGDPLPLLAASSIPLTLLVVGVCGVVPYLLVLHWPWRKRAIT